MESEAESMLSNMTTGKYRAVCATMGLPPDTPPDAVLDAVLDTMNGTKRAFFNWLAFVPASWIDGAIERLMARSPKK